MRTYRLILEDDLTDKSWRELIRCGKHEAQVDGSGKYVVIEGKYLKIDKNSGSLKPKTMVFVWTDGARGNFYCCTKAEFGLKIRQMTFKEVQQKAMHDKQTDPQKADSEYNYVWFMRKVLCERKGYPCRVLSRSGKKEIVVEFKDGFQVVTTRHALRKTPPPQIQLNLDTFWV